MDENNIFRLRVLERTEEMLDGVVEEKAAPKFSYPNQTNPLVRKMVQFQNEKIGDKFSMKDLLR